MTTFFSTPRPGQRRGVAASPSLWLFLALLAAGLILVAEAAQSPARTEAKTAKPAAKTPAGIEAAQALSTITGVAISPLLGVSAVGAYQYYQNSQKSAEQQKPLPWNAQPWFFLSGLLVVGLCTTKDVLGPATPTALKKPIDVAETLENKLSGLVAAGAFVPMAAAIFPGTPGAGASLSAAGFAAIDFSWFLNLVTVPLALAAFAVVWLVAHAINVLILISPFSTVDTALKAFRTFLLTTVAGTALFDPVLGAVWSLIIILIAWLLAGWSFRLMVFGMVFVWDFATLRRHRFTPKKGGNWMFTARPIDQTPVRTYGQLRRNEKGDLVFRYRPWLVLAEREQVLPEGVYAVGRGLIYPEVLQLQGERQKTVILLPPRYRGHEEELTNLYGLAAVQDIGLLKGFKAIWHWVKSLFGFGLKTAPSA